jgi:probable addiction module antidote protein
MSTDAETFTPFDAANYLDTVDDVAAYLEAVIDEADDDPTVIAQALGSIARSRNFS